MYDQIDLQHHITVQKQVYYSEGSVGEWGEVQILTVCLGWSSYHSVSKGPSCLKQPAG